MTWPSKIIIESNPPFDLEDYAHLMIRRAVRRNDEVGEAVMEAAIEKTGDRAWTMDKWRSFLIEIERSDAKVSSLLPAER